MQLFFISNAFNTLIDYLREVVRLASCEILSAFPEAFVVTGPPRLSFTESCLGATVLVGKTVAEPFVRELAQSQYSPKCIKTKGLTHI